MQRMVPAGAGRRSHVVGVGRVAQGISCASGSPHVRDWKFLPVGDLVEGSATRPDGDPTMTSINEVTNLVRVAGPDARTASAYLKEANAGTLGLAVERPGTLAAWDAISIYGHRKT